MFHWHCQQNMAKQPRWRYRNVGSGTDWEPVCDPQRDSDTGYGTGVAGSAGTMHRREEKYRLILFGMVFGPA
jgi:hypothetical protein